MGPSGGASQILQYLARLYPTLAPKITQALALGYSVDKVLQYIFKSQKQLSNLAGGEQGMSKYKSAEEAAASGYPEGLKKAGKAVLGIASAAGGLAALPRIGAALAGGAGRAAQTAVRAPNISPASVQPTGLIGAAGVPIPPPIAPGGGPTQQQAAAQFIARQKKAKPPTLREQLIQQSQQHQGKTSAAVAHGPQIGAIPINPVPGAQINPQTAGQMGQNPQNPISAQSNLIPPGAQMGNSPGENPLSAGNSDMGTEIKEPRQEITEPEKPIESGSKVFTPAGDEGKVISVNGDQAVVEVNGRKRKFPIDELGSLSEDFISGVDDIISQIPENERSSVMAFGSFAPDLGIGGKVTPAMLLQYHDGSTYLYPDATQQDFDDIFGKAYSARTTGENSWRAWTQGEASRGAGRHVIAKQLEEKFGKNYIKFPPTFDTFKRIRYAAKILGKRRKKSGNT